MENQEVSYLLHRIANLLEIKGETDYKTNAYKRAAQAISRMPNDIEALFNAGKLQEISGVGPHLEALITEIITTGSAGYLNELEQEVPPELADFAILPGIGTEIVTTLFKHTSIRTPEELYRAIKDKSLPEVPGLDKQVIFRIKRALQKWEVQGDLIDLGTAVPMSKALLELVRMLPYVEQVSVVGDLRRGLEVVKEIVILAASPEVSRVIDFFKGLPIVKTVLSTNSNHCRVKIVLGMIVELRVVPPQLYALEQILGTGNSNHVERLSELAVQQGMITTTDKWEEWVRRLHLNTEADIYHRHQLNYVPPEIRETGQELTEGCQGISLIKDTDIKGDLHMHTVWSDGHNTVLEMAMKAKEMGYQYIAICDHSKSLSIAGGLNEERLRLQQAEIAELNQRNIGISILSGIELDILPDRRLDFSDDVLKEMDIVVGSIHSGFKQDADIITTRIELAMKNEHVDIIAHPTGRMLRRRSGYQLNFERIFETAVKTDTALEINASPNRLDLRDIHVRQAKEFGCKLVINTDAHDMKHLSDMNYGITNARRGWVQTGDVINTMDTYSLTKYLANRKYSLV